MPTQEPAVAVTLPAKTISLRLGRSAITTRQNLTDGSFVMAFKDVQRCLSLKPLKRPNRIRPIA